ncbi:SUMF1/EgtB/PvdO family nonheme iron enzyme [Microcoleus sp. FACHB-SPT15]|uniref:SUMF1/EgtB/PvdO family nonheme iron enzyme n=1 Tax=Microcoleus sp. FACHB-SPT15 TaxID=2692830 RepID=UPI001784CD1D|nr:SUMF1/EgtB/PvdO family nonheme iron enzyme [Microcoleus sp. FACHB-SPT15]MBD1806315.1 SUMF1/EgtB/PvdO family nonheme iron enzyme [Microcoleus sp. FACHB-SPT15]
MRRAFVVGSNGPTNLSPLRYARKDAERIKACLEGSRCGFEVMSPQFGAKPFEVREQLYEFAESCTSEDTFVCYFSGHGILEKGALFLLWDNTEINRLGTTSILVSDIIQAFRFCKAHSTLLILDCCHAGAAVNMTGLRNAVGEPIEELIHPNNHLVLMASDRLERARELEELEGGFLTTNICSALGDKFHEADENNDNKLSIQELMQWLTERAREHNRQFSDKRVPYPYTFGQERGNFFLSRDDSTWTPYEIPWADGSTMVVLPIYPQKGMAFCIGKHPITNAQYKKFVESRLLGKEPVGKHYYELNEVKSGWQGPFYPWQEKDFSEPEKPVVCVSYEDAVEYSAWVNSCDPYNYTEIPFTKLWNFAALGTEYLGLDPKTWVNQTPQSHQQASSPAPIDLLGYRWNSRGVSDMFGNVWEWCTEADPPALGDDPSTKVAVRGGSFLDYLYRSAPFLSASNLLDNVETRHSDLGFRIAGKVYVKDLPEEIKLQLELCKKISALNT